MMHGVFCGDYGVGVLGFSFGASFHPPSSPPSLSYNWIPLPFLMSYNTSMQVNIDCLVLDDVPSISLY